MADIATLGIKIENGSAIVALDQLATKLDVVGVRGESTVARLKSAFGGLAAATGLSLFGAKILKETIDAQDAMAQLEQRVKSTGGVAGYTAQQLDDLSTSLQSVSTYSDEAVKGAETMLLTFGKVKGDTFTRATSDILDLAQAMGGDLQGAAIQVGKALQDPEQGMLALRRSGVSFSDSQQQIIKDLFNTGQEAKAQAMILSELEKEFGGSATAARGTLGGALKGLGNDFGDLFEKTTDETQGLTGFINSVDNGVKSLHFFGEELKTVALLLGVAGVVAAANLASKAIGGVVASIAATQLAMQVGTGSALLHAGFVALTGTAAALSLGLGVLGLAVYDIDKAFEEHDDALEEASKNTKEYVEYLKALGHAHSQAGGAGQLHTKATVDETAAVKALLSERDIELRKLTELNQSYNQNDLARARIEARYEAEAQKAKDAVEHHGKELEALNKVTDALAAQKIKAAEMTAAQSDFNDMIEKGAAFQDKMQAALAKTVPEWTLNRKAYDSIIESLKVLNAAHDNEIVKIGQENIARGKAQVNQAAEQIKQANKYSDDLSKIWRDGIAKITTDGFKSFLDFAEDLNQLFTKLMDRMAERARQLGKEAGGAGYTALGLGAAAIGGALTGYNIGSGSGSYGTGVLGGAASGAVAGSAFGPWGTVIGGLAGAVSGLLGAAHAHDEAAKQLQEAARSMRANVTSYVTGSYGNDTLSQLTAENQRYQDLIASVVALNKQKAISGAETITQLNALDAAHKRYVDGIVAAQAEALSDFRDSIDQGFNALNGPAGAYQNQLAALAKQYKDNLAAANALGGTWQDLTKVTNLYNQEVAALAAQYQNQIDQQNGAYQVRLLNATGNSDAAFALQQSLELEDAVAKGLEPATLAILEQAQQAEAAQREREKQTTLLQDQLSAEQQQLEQNKAAYDSLTALKASLAIGQYSPLSPRQQLDATRTQLNTAYGSALGGNLDAERQFESLLPQFLDMSRKYNASGAGFVMDYNSANVMTDALQQAFGQRVSDSQAMVTLLQASIDKLNDVKDSVETLTRTLATGDNDLGRLQQGLTQATLDRMGEVKGAIDASANVLKKGLESVRVAVVNS